MSRWTQYDEDEYRLPEGFERIGYDSDTGQYYFRDRQGSIWEGAPGAEYSEMTRISTGSHVDIDSDDEDESNDLEAGGTRSDGYRSLATDSSPMAYPPTKPTILGQPGAYQHLFPFFLMIAVLLLLAWRYIINPSLSAASEHDSCPGFHDSKNNNLRHETAPYLVQPGDTCWQIAQDHKCNWELFAVINSELDCERLLPGTTLCLPVEPTITQEGFHSSST